MKRIHKTLHAYVRPESEIVLLEVKGQFLQGETFDTFSGGGGGMVIDPDPDDGEDDNHSNAASVWDTL